MIVYLENLFLFFRGVYTYNPDLINEPSLANGRAKSSCSHGMKMSKRFGRKSSRSGRSKSRGRHGKRKSRRGRSSRGKKRRGGRGRKRH